MKKVLALTLCTILTASVLAGCGAKTETPSTETTSESTTETTEEVAEEVAAISGDITFLTNRTDLDENGTYAEYIAKFNEKYPDVTVNVESITDYAGEMATRMQTTEYGDVCMIPDAVPTKDLGTYFDSLGTDADLANKYAQEYLYAKWYAGEVYGLPSLVSVQGLCYNKEVFKEAGITELPKTEEDFLTALQTIKDNTDAIPYYTDRKSVV